MALEFTWLSYYAAIFGFIFVFFIIFAILKKTQILGNENWISLVVSLVISLVFISFSPGVDYISTIIPWFAILIVSLFLILVIVGFSQKDLSSFMKPGLAWVFIIFLILIFLISAIVVFNPFINSYLPGQADSGGNSYILTLKHFFYSEKFVGGAILAIVAVVAAWILMKKKK